MEDVMAEVERGGLLRCEAPACIRIELHGRSGARSKQQVWQSQVGANHKPPSIERGSCTADMGDEMAGILETFLSRCHKQCKRCRGGRLAL